MVEDSSEIALWRSEAAGELASLQAADGGWPYIAGQTSATEPTALAMLALAAAGAEGYRRPEAAVWLAARQRGDGLFTASPLVEEGGWLTAPAGIAMLRDGWTDLAGAAASALLDEAAYTFYSPLTANVYNYDTRLRGWPWTPGDFSLVEPTALAMIFLKQAGYRDHVRVREAADMLRNRAVAGGGWNYGEPRVWNGDLFPITSNTGMVLAALADEQDSATAAGLAWLLSQRGLITSLPSIGWAAIGLNVLGSLDDAWRTDVIERWRSSPAERRGPMETALCLLGLSEASVHPLGVTG